MSAATAPSRGGIYLQGLLCGVGAALMPGVAVLLGILLMPPIAVFLLDHGRRQGSARPMLLMAAATAMMPLRALWDAGLGLTAALDLCQPGTVALSWLAAATGWLIVEATGVLASQIAKAARQRRRAALRAEQEALEYEWGRLDDCPG